MSDLPMGGGATPRMPPLGISGRSRIGTYSPPLAPSPQGPAYDPGAGNDRIAAAKASRDTYANQQFNQWYARQAPEDLADFHPDAVSSSATVAGPHGTFSSANPADEAARNGIIRANARQYFMNNEIINDPHYQSLDALHTLARDARAQGVTPEAYGAPVSAAPGPPLDPRVQAASIHAQSAADAARSRAQGEFGKAVVGEIGKTVRGFGAGLSNVFGGAVKQMNENRRLGIAQQNADAHTAAARRTNAGKQPVTAEEQQALDLWRAKSSAYHTAYGKFAAGNGPDPGPPPVKPGLQATGPHTPPIRGTQLYPNELPPVNLPGGLQPHPSGNFQHPSGAMYRETADGYEKIK